MAHLKEDHWNYFPCTAIEKIAPEPQRRYANFWKKSCLEAVLSSPVNVGVRLNGCLIDEVFWDSNNLCDSAKKIHRQNISLS